MGRSRRDVRKCVSHAFYDRTHFYSSEDEEEDEEGNEDEQANVKDILIKMRKRVISHIPYGAE